MKMFERLSLAYFLIFLNTAFCLYGSGDNVIELTDQNFDQITSSAGVWFVSFYSPQNSRSRNEASDWKTFATTLIGIINVGAVNSDENKITAQKFSIRDYPSILIFGEDKHKPVKYTGGRSAKQLSDEALRRITALLKSRIGSTFSDDSDQLPVIELTDNNFDELVLNSEEPWLVEFFAPWCGHCKNLKPHWDQAAKELKGVVKVGALDATIHNAMSQKYGIRGFPTIKFFPAGPKTSSPIDYDGGRTSEAIVSWVTEKVEIYTPAPDVIELTSSDIFKTACEEHILCIIGVLPMLYDCQTDCRNKYLDIMKKEAEIYKKQKWGWIWTEALKHPKLEETFDIGGSGYPAMLAVHGRKMKRTTMRGSFTQHSVHDFLRSLAAGGVNLPLFDINVMPEIKSVEPWDGKDAPPIEQEPIDLSDLYSKSEL